MFHEDPPPLYETNTRYNSVYVVKVSYAEHDGCCQLDAWKVLFGFEVHPSSP
jgi:hypothetical protein